MSLGAVVVVAGVMQNALSKDQQWTSSNDNGANVSFVPVALPVPQRLDWSVIAEHDPDFSPVLLEDYLHELFTRVQMARAEPEAMTLLAPYVSSQVRQHRSRNEGKIIAVTGVIVGSTTLTSLTARTREIEITVEYEAQFTEVRKDEARPRGVYTRELWTLERSRGARSRPPEQITAFNCPSCGGPVEVDHPDACRQCGSLYSSNDHEWKVVQTRVLARELRPPTLTEYAEEVGTNLPTRGDRNVEIELARLSNADADFDADQFGRRVALVYHALNKAWSSLVWTDAQPYCTDRQWRSMNYWIEAYRAQGLRNEMRAAAIEKIVIAKVAADKHYRSIVVRVYASAVDVTVRSDDGSVVCGDGGRRRYSEYWTFIRSVARLGKAGVAPECPSCSAPFTLGMSGTCQHCGVKLTTGEFDWVLSKIEQDEVYRG
jgi:predicted lipid-binding transport protein (Tim44 family)